MLNPFIRQIFGFQKQNEMCVCTYIKGTMNYDETLSRVMHFSRSKNLFALKKRMLFLKAH